MKCNFRGCDRRATHYESLPPTPYLPGVEAYDRVAAAYCESHFSEEDCPFHTSSDDDPKVCGRCGVHIDSLRPPED